MKAPLNMLTLGVLVFGFSAMVPGKAQAEHGPFAYRGSLCGFRGESQLIAALGHIDRAYEEQVHGHWSHAHREADFAAADLHTVCGLLSSGHARSDVYAAEQSLERYCHTRSIRDLQSAARLVSHALQIEQSAFRYGHGHGHSHSGYGQNPYPVNSYPYQVPVTVPQSARPRITFRLGF